MAAQEEEQSMEEILQSIKKIIAEDEEGGEAVEAAEVPETLEITDIDDLPQEPPEKEEPAPSQDDVDEMFDEIEVEPAPEPEPAAKEAAEVDAGLEEIAEALEEDDDDDILELTDDMEDDGGLSGFDEPEPIEEIAEAEESVVEEIAAEPAPVAAETAGALLSNEAASQAASALAQLKQPAPAPAGEKLSFRSGATVEDLVLEALRPMLKEWLNNELPSTVERMVAEEIKRISK